jgi:hypothetical protein
MLDVALLQMLCRLGCERKHSWVWLNSFTLREVYRMLHKLGHLCSRNEIYTVQLECLQFLLNCSLVVHTRRYSNSALVTNVKYLKEGIPNPVALLRFPTTALRRGKIASDGPRFD